MKSNKKCKLIKYIILISVALFINSTGHAMSLSKNICLRVPIKMQAEGDEVEIAKAKEILAKEREFLNSFIPVEEFQEKFPGTVRFSDIVTINNGQGTIDNNKRITSEYDESLASYLHDKEVLDGFVEVPAQRLVTEILKFGGNTIWSNAYGPYIKGVVWEMNRTEYFTPLTEQDYIVTGEMNLRVEDKEQINKNL